MNKSFDDSGAVTDGRLKHIVLVGGDDQNFRSFLGLNAEFTVIQIAGAVGSNQRQAAHRIYEVDDFDYSTLSKIIRQVHDLKRIDYLYSFFETSLCPSAILAQELGVRGLDSLSCDLSINKNKLREHPGAGVLSTAARGGRHRIAACRALLGKFDVGAFVKMLPPNIALLTTSYWTDYPLGKVTEKASNRFGYIAVGFDSMSAFGAMFETFDHMVSRAESGHPHTQLCLH